MSTFYIFHWPMEVDGGYDSGTPPTGYGNDTWINKNLEKIQIALAGTERWSCKPWPHPRGPTKEKIEWMKKQDGGLAYCEKRSKGEIDADKQKRLENGDEPLNYEDAGNEVFATKGRESL